MWFIIFNKPFSTSLTHFNYYSHLCSFPLTHYTLFSHLCTYVLTLLCITLTFLRSCLKLFYTYVDLMMCLFTGFTPFFTPLTPFLYKTCDFCNWPSVFSRHTSSMDEFVCGWICIMCAFNNKEYDFKIIAFVFVLKFFSYKKIITNDIWWLEVGAGQKLGLYHLPTWSEVGARLVVKRWGSPVLRLVPQLLTRVWLEDGADRAGWKMGHNKHTCTSKCPCPYIHDCGFFWRVWLVSPETQNNESVVNNSWWYHIR